MPQMADLFMKTRRKTSLALAAAFCALWRTAAAEPKKWMIPELPGGRPAFSAAGPELIAKPAAAQNDLKPDVRVAKEPPTVDFLFLPGQDYEGNPWSNWGDGCAAGDKYYTAIGDHQSPRGNAFVYEYDSSKKTVRILASLREFLDKHGGLAANETYRPGKIHSRLCLGADGWLYYTTHRGSGRDTTDKFGFKGDWLLRTLPDPDPAKVKTEIVAAYPVPKHCLPAGMLDAERMIWYGGSAAGADAALKGIVFLAYDAANRKTLLCAENRGFDRCAILVRSTGCVYWNPAAGGKDGDGQAEKGGGLKYDPRSNEIVPSPNVPHVRSATTETAEGMVYGTSHWNCDIWAFNTRTEQCSVLGDGAVGKATYTTSMEVDPSGRYLYYVPGAHGGAWADGSPVVQYDVMTRTRKVIAFMNALEPMIGARFEGTFSTALSPGGDTLYVTWNMGRPRWDCCAITAIRIPESERKP